MKRILILLVVVMMFGSAIVQAQGFGQQGFGEQGIQNRRYSSERHERSMSFLVGQLVTSLELDWEQSEKFFPLWHAYYQSMQKLTFENQALTQQMKVSIRNEDIETEEIMKLLEKREKNVVETQKQRDDFYKRAKDILGDRQYIELVVFEDSLKEQIMNMVNQFNRNSPPQ